MTVLAIVFIVTFVVCLLATLLADSMNAESTAAGSFVVTGFLGLALAIVALAHG